MDDEISATRAPAVAIDHSEPGVLCLRLSGRWMLDASPPSAAKVFERARAATDRRARIESDQRLQWDSGLLIFLRDVLDEAQRREMSVDFAGLPVGAQRLVALASDSSEHADRDLDGDQRSTLDRLGARVLAIARSALDALAFVGEAGVGVCRVASGSGRVRHADLLQLVQETGARALPIVSLLTFLVGVILAYVGAVQLRALGAQAYVADLVSLAMTREVGAMMTAVVMAGRTGAAFAAQLGTMQVNDEIDALTTFGISPMEFLVVPRLIALAVMMPLLCLYADLLGMLGGAAVGVGLLGLGGLEYYHRSLQAIGLNDFAAGLIKASVFGVLVAAAGCLRGMRSGRTAAAVGAAATSAVVTAIVLIIVADAALTVLFDLLRL